MSNQKAAKVVQLYFKTHSPVTVIRVMRKRHPLDNKLTKLQVHRLVRRFQQTGSVEDTRLKNTGRPLTSRSDELVAVVKDLITERQ